MNKPAKDFLKRRFEDWCAKELAKQLEGMDVASTVLQPISLILLVLKELGAKWLVEMADYFGKHPEIIVNGFIRARITEALSGKWDELEEEDRESDEEERETDK